MGIIAKAWDGLVLGMAEIWDFILWLFWRKKKEPERQQIQQNVPAFSAYEYMGRMEAASVEIMRKTQKRPKYQIVLWAGLDGLRMNEDGTTEWIRREEEKKPNAPIENVGSLRASYYNQLLSVSCETENTIFRLQAQLQNTCIQQQVMMQNQQIVNAVQPAYLTVYSPYQYCQPAYYGTLCRQMQQ